MSIRSIRYKLICMSDMKNEDRQDLLSHAILLLPNANTYCNEDCTLKLI